MPCSKPASSATTSSCLTAISRPCTGTTAAASTSGTGSTAGGAPSASRSAFRKCLAQHGVTLPNRRRGDGTPPAGGSGHEPGGGGGFFGGGGGFANNPKLAAAFQACGRNRLPP